MRSSDLFPSHIHEAARLARELSAPFDVVREQIRLFERTPVHQMMEQFRRDDAVRRAMFGYGDLIERFRSVSEIVRLHEDFAHLRRAMFPPEILEQAHQAARMAETFALPSAIEQFRTSIEPLADKLLYLRTLDLIHQPAYLDAFNQASAVSDMLANATRVGLEVRQAMQAFRMVSVPTFETLTGYRNFLDAAGLTLPRWPRVRLLTAAEKRRRLKARLKEMTEPVHIKKAKSLVHRYELTLRELLDAVMAEKYGEDWAIQRLPLCGCNDLLKKWQKRGGADDVLDHADYAHYARIMSNPDHFAAVFEAGFDDPDVLAALMTEAGRLRAASHHARAFTPEDLRDLRMTWRTIETGLVAFIDDYTLDFDQ